MQKICDTTQEAIALGGDLTVDEHEHLRTCQKCKLLYEEYQFLNLMISDISDNEVPVGFAESVMKAIEDSENSQQIDWMERFLGVFERALVIPQVQYVALGLGGAVSLLTLMRFVFFVLIPVG